MNQATITVTFYGDSNDNSVRQLKKKYVVKNWRDETDLRRLVDEIADEMNYISGYGIDSIAVVAEHLKFTIDYRNKYRPYKEIMDFWDSLVLKVGQQGKKKVWFEIPRVYIFVFDGQKQPMQKYDPLDRLLQIRENGNVVRIDHDNPIWSSFLHKIYGGKILFPYTTNEWTHEQPKAGKKFIAYSLSLLPSRQTTTHQFEKKRNQKKKQQHKEELDKKRCERLGIVYKNKKKKEKAKQVYVIQQLDEHGFNNLYKIGISNAPGKRLQALTTSNPFELKIVHTFAAEPAEEAEAQLHAKYEHIHQKGEWFKLNPAELAELKRITAFRNGQFINGETA